MSDNIQNEQDLWDVLSEPVTVESKAPKAEPKPKANPDGRFAKPGPMKEPKPEQEKSRFDGFFFASMAGVAAVAVAATLLVSSMLGGGEGTPAASAKDPAVNETVSVRIEELELENAELRAKLDQQKQQIKDLQSDLMTLMGSEEYLSTVSTDPNESNEVLDAQVKALDTLAQIQEAYADFDREKLEELIPQMDEQLAYLTPEALNNYYLILEYVEQPSNG